MSPLEWIAAMLFITMMVLFIILAVVAIVFVLIGIFAKGYDPTREKEILQRGKIK